MILLDQNLTGFFFSHIINCSFTSTFYLPYQQGVVKSSLFLMNINCEQKWKVLTVCDEYSYNTCVCIVSVFSVTQVYDLKLNVVKRNEQWNSMAGNLRFILHVILLSIKCL